MTTALLWTYHTGTALFLGSILTFVVGSILAAHDSLDNLVCIRRLIRKGTLTLTMPGLWLAALSLVGLSLAGGLPVWRLVAVAAVLVTSHALIVPATQRCLHWASESKVDGKLHPAYRAAYLRESIPGALNVLVMLGLLFRQG
jgi:hypothetical protein